MVRRSSAAAANCIPVVPVRGRSFGGSEVEGESAGFVVVVGGSEVVVVGSVVVVVSSVDVVFGVVVVVVVGVTGNVTVVVVDGSSMVVVVVGGVEEVVVWGSVVVVSAVVVVVVGVVVVVVGVVVDDGMVVVAHGSCSPLRLNVQLALPVGSSHASTTTIHECPEASQVNVSVYDPPKSATSAWVWLSMTTSTELAPLVL